MERKSFAEMPCSIAQCLDIVGDSWTLLIVRDAFSGSTRFDDFQQWLGIPRNTLKDRLDKLVGAGVLEKVAQVDHAARYDYLLTDRGRDLWPILAAMRQWGDRHGGEGRPSLRMVHVACGTPISIVGACAACGEQVARDDVALHQLTLEP